jgi:sulfatase modifying factor 1
MKLGPKLSARWTWFGMSLTAMSCGQAPPTPPMSPPSASMYAGQSDAGEQRVESNALLAPPSAMGSASLPDAQSLESLREREAGAASQASESDDATADGAAKAAEEGPCPAGMLLVDTDYCPRIERHCLDEEYSPQNHFTICHKFAETQRCLVPVQHRHFCMDEYEYPNQKGAHPPWMVSWYDGQSTCGSIGKRLCFESEWVAACEGPDQTPFPYGYERDNSKCNVDNTWIQPHLADLYRKDETMRDKELARLDQSAASGALVDCVSGFGVHDMTGNFDEWVTADHRYDDRSDWAALKGGAWGHVRNACRPTTTTHPPDFTYYFIGFRCCKDAADSEPYVPESASHIPNVEPKDRAPIPSPVDAPGPSPTKVAREHWPKPVAGR